MSTSYKIRKFTNGKNSKGDPFTNYSLTVPAHVAKELPEDVTFSCELSEDGILFRPVAPQEAETTLPSWAKANGSVPKTEAKPKATARKAPAAKAKAEPKEEAKPAAKKAPARKAPAAKAAPKEEAKTETKAAPRKAPVAKKAAPKTPAKSTAASRPRPGAKKPVAA